MHCLTRTNISLRKLKTYIITYIVAFSDNHVFPDISEISINGFETTRNFIEIRLSFKAGSVRHSRPPEIVQHKFLQFGLMFISVTKCPKLPVRDFSVCTFDTFVHSVIVSSVLFYCAIFFYQREGRNDIIIRNYFKTLMYAIILFADISR